MNIFVLDSCPVTAASYVCDVHVVSQSKEAAQLLSTAVPTTYRVSHRNHPCAVWTRESRSNFYWLVEHGLALCSEYSRRYGGKVHKSLEIIQLASLLGHRLEDKGLTPFAQAMPDAFRQPCAVEAYRLYYRYGKDHLAVWNHGPTPYWWSTSS